MVRSEPQTKSAKVIKLLSRGKGANIDEICKATHWKPHSVRAFLAGLRKKGFVLTREQRGYDGIVYCITERPLWISSSKS